MPIQYGEFTVIHNEEEEGIIKSIFRTWGGYEFQALQTSQIVVLFEDGEICEINDKFKDFNYKFLDDNASATPYHFDKNKSNKEKYERVYFKKSPIEDKDGNKRINCADLFKSYTKYVKQNSIPSKYNFIYYIIDTAKNNPEVFGVIRIKSSESKPRFQFAYDSEHFSKEEVIYLINYIFKNKIQSL
jgi:hypothetical protein